LHSILRPYTWLTISSIDNSSLPDGVQPENILGGGTTALVAFHPDSGRAIKFAHESRVRGSEYGILEFEYTVFTRLQTPTASERIIRCYAYAPAGISNSKESLELEYACNGTLRQHLRKQGRDDTPLGLRYHWAIQIAEAVIFVHSRGILHGDLNLANVLLDKELNVKVTDFSFSQIMDSKPRAQWTPPMTSRYQTGYRPPGMETCVASEVYAFGSALYELFTGKRPYEELLSSDFSHRAAVDALCTEKKFPDLTAVSGPTKVIMNCWRMDYLCVAEIKAQLELEATSAE
jgi:serine/threonine protein kinase